MVDAVLMELEGVVFDTRALRADSLHDGLAAHGLGELPTNDVVLRDLVLLRAERSFSARLAAVGASLRDGAREFVDMAASQARLVVVTRASRDDAATMLRLSGLGDRFAMLVCAEDTREAKPSSEGHRVAIERLNRRRPTPLHAILTLEAEGAGIRAARGAGVRCVAVGPLAAHVAIEADAYVESLAGQTLRGLDKLSQPGQERVQ